MNTGPSAHESSMSPISCVYHRSGTVQVNWSRPTDSGSTENARLENRKLFKIHFKLLYLRFPPLQIRTCVFCTCIFHPCIFVLTYSVLAYIPSSGTFVFRTCVFSRPYWVKKCMEYEVEGPRPRGIQYEICKAPCCRGFRGAAAVTCCHLLHFHLSQKAEK